MAKAKLRVVVRAVEERDAEAVAEIHRSPGVVHGTLQLPLRSVDFVKKRFAGLSKDDHLIVAEHEGRIVGVAGLHHNPRPRQRHVASLGMSVRDDARGRGIGAALLDALLDLGERWLGILRFELEVYSDNAAALRLYRGRGFEVEGVARAYAMRDGALVDVLRMARVSKTSGWPRLTAEELSNRPPPALPSAGPGIRARRSKRNLPN